ncbi:tyrosine-type recombinase/integrase [Phycisphaerales bacterium AB-hyl4]|uniref:Tyrosine-type recombinase/integrase n=1 Tax=Natronomicrosphaera hydrolytica TaxID=3242702 RepID=A0ABV4U9L6_9BACT
MDEIGPLADRFPRNGRTVAFADGRLHSFRHFFCSIAFRSGVEETTIMEWLGHHSSQVTAIYRHLGDRTARERIDRIRFVESMLQRSDVQESQ